MSALPPLVVVGLVIGTLALVGSLARRFSQSVIPAYIVAGVVLGPSIPRQLGPIPLALVGEPTYLHVFANLGVVVLLFFLGLHVDVNNLLENGREIVGSSLVDLAVNFGAGLLLAFAFGFSTLEALFVAGIVYISSSAIISKSLAGRGWIVEPESDAILGTLIVEDLVIAIYLALLTALALDGGSVTDAALRTVEGFVFLGVVGIGGWKATGLVESLFETASEELFLLRVLGVTVFLAGSATYLKVSPGVTALFVGAALGPTDHAQRIERHIEPVRNLFVAVFFFTIGLSTDLSGVVAVAGFLAVAVLTTTASKFLSGTIGGYLYGLDCRRSFRVGVGMLARGELSLVLAQLARTAGTGALSHQVPEFAVGYVLAMSVVGTLSIRYESQLAGFVRRVSHRIPGCSTPE